MSNDRLAFTWQGMPQQLVTASCGTSLFLKLMASWSLLMSLTTNVRKRIMEFTNNRISRNSNYRSRPSLRGLR